MQKFFFSILESPEKKIEMKYCDSKKMFDCKKWNDSLICIFYSIRDVQNVFFRLKGENNVATFFTQCFCNDDQSF